MGIKISAMNLDASVSGVELIPVSDAGSPKAVTTAVLKQYVIDAIEALAAASSVTGADSVFVLQGGVMKPADIDLIAQHAIDTVWGKAANAAPLAGDSIPIKKVSGAVEGTVVLSVLAEYVRGAIEASILDVSDIATASALADGDYMLVTQGSAGKKVALSAVVTKALAGLNAYITALTAVSSIGGTDVIHVIQGGVEKKATVTQLHAAVGTTIAPATTTDGKIPQWDSASKTLKDGLTLRSSVRASGTADAVSVPSEAAVRLLAAGIIPDAPDASAALADDDTILVYDLSATTQVESTLSRLWTWILSKIVAIVDVSTHGWVLDEDTMASDSALKVPTQQSVKAYVDRAVYGHIWVPASDMKESTTAGSTAAAIEYGTNDLTHAVQVFAGDTADESAEFNLVMPPEWDRGTIKFKALWAPGHANSNPDEYIKLTMAAGAFSNDDALDAALGTGVAVEDQASTDDDLLVTDASAAITVGGSPALLDLIHFKITRDWDYAGAGAAMDVDLRLFGVVIQYTKSAAVAAW